MSRHPHGCCAFWYIMQHHRVRADSRMRPDYYCAQNFRPGTDKHAVAQCGVSFAGMIANSSQSHALVQHDVIAEHRRLSDDDSGAMVYEQPLTDSRTGVYLHPGYHSADLRDDLRCQSMLM